MKQHRIQHFLQVEAAVHFVHFSPQTMSETETYEQSDDQSSAVEIEEQRQPRKGGKGGHHKREEPTYLIELQACPMAVSCFQYMSCYEFCERISRI